MLITFTIGILCCLIPLVTSEVASTYRGSLSSSSARFIRAGQSSGVFYYQALQLTIRTTGEYTIRSDSLLDTYGYLYVNSFDPSHPAQNLIAYDDDSGTSGQFLFNVTLGYGRTFVLVVTTYAQNITGSYLTTAFGPSTIAFHLIPTPTPTPSPVVPSTYSSSLSYASGIFIPPGRSSGIYYYQAIQVTNYGSGKYTFRSSSSMDTYGYFYSDSFDPTSPSQNLIASDDDSGGSRQFLLNVTLTYGGSYILVVTTYASGIIGDYSVTALGPSTIVFNPIPVTTSTPSTTTSTALVPSYYSSALTSHSGVYIRPSQIIRSFYYEAIVLIVYSTNNFVVRSSSILDTYGYLYSGSFNPLYPFDNLIASDDDSGGSGQFLLNVTLTYGSSYTLVVTTYSPNITGSYGVAALGPSTMYFFPYGPTTTTTSAPSIPSSYSTALSSNSGKYIRPGQTTDDYFYQAIRVTVYTGGKYSFRSSSSMDTYGYFYSDSFDPSNPSQNLIISDDDSGGNRQFLLNVTLTQGESYILVVTTYATNVFGDFTVHSLGPAIVNWAEIAPTFLSTFGLVGILAVVFTSIAFLGIILSVCAYCYARRTRQRTINVKAQPDQMPYFISLEKPSLSNN